MRTALIIGANRQGEKYLAAFASLPQTHRFQRVIITRTTKEGAEETARKHAELNIIGEKIATTDDTRLILEKYRPDFIGITAKDPQQTHDIHFPYALVASEFAPVLIEKPFGNPHQDRRALKHIDELARTAIYPVGLELTYTPVANIIWKDTKMKDLLRKSKTLNLFWVSRPKGDTRPDEDILAQLMVHAVSLIPEYPITFKKATVDTRKAILEYQAGTISGKIYLTYGGNYSGFEIGTAGFVIKRLKGRMEVHKLTIPTTEAIQKGNDAIEGELLFQIPYPLQQHIIALLEGKPLVGFEGMKESQQALEDAHRIAHKP